MFNLIVIVVTILTHLTSTYYSVVNNNTTAKKKEIIQLDKYCRVNLKTKKVYLQGKITDNTGLLEYLACLPDTKEYESLIVLYSKPSVIHTALLMIGLVPGCNNPELGTRNNSNSAGSDKEEDLGPCTIIKTVKRGKESFKVYQWIPKGDKVIISALWTDKKTGKKNKRRIEELIINTKTKKPFKNIEWVFNGSEFTDEFDYETNKLTGKKIYSADVTGTIIGMQFDPNVVISWPFFIGNAWANISTYVNKKLSPPAGTKVTLLIEPAKKSK